MIVLMKDSITKIKKGIKIKNKKEVAIEVAVIFQERKQDNIFVYINKIKKVINLDGILNFSNKVEVSFRDEIEARLLIKYLKEYINVEILNPEVLYQ